jgi:nicotinamidase-related amidase
MEKNQRRFIMIKTDSRGVWKAAECALVLSDYQDHILDTVWQRDRRVIELNVCTLAKMAVAFKIPVILSTVGVEMGATGPTFAALRAAVPGVKDIDRNSMDAWDDPKFVAAVEATGRKRLVMGAIATSVCLAFPAIDAMAAGYEVAFVVDAVGDHYLEQHDAAILRLGLAGAVPTSTVSMIAEWFRDWGSPMADEWRKVLVPYYDEMAALKNAPEIQKPRGMTALIADWKGKSAAPHARAGSAA